MSKGFLYDEGDELITRKEDAGGLPDTDEASAGDVLSLNEDKEPVWSAPSGGGGGLVITVDVSGGPTSLDDTYSGFPTNKTWNDVKNALESGIVPFIIVPTEGEVSPFYVTYVSESEQIQGYPYTGYFVQGNFPGELSPALLVASSSTGTMYYAFSQGE